MNIQTIDGRKVWVNTRYIVAVEARQDGITDIVVSFHNRDGTYSVRASLDSIVTRINNAKEGA
jgi:uncharacterized protein YlzI (FlbEa/FlbD family)